MIKILTDSVASIPADVARKAGIDIVTLYVNRDGRELADADIDLDAFYADIYDMVDDIPTSSQPSQHTLESVFEQAAQAGDEVLGIFISTGLSGAYEGAVRATRRERPTTSASRTRSWIPARAATTGVAGVRRRRRARRRAGLEGYAGPRSRASSPRASCSRRDAHVLKKGGGRI